MVEEHQDKIALFYLPACSPNLNPNKYLNQDYKRSANKEQIPTNKKELEHNTRKLHGVATEQSRKSG